MNNSDYKETPDYGGFEQGPIRPPSESGSLLIRVTRNCPWNRCTFCPVYKEDKFSLRPVDHVIKDIDAVHRQIETIREISETKGYITRTQIQEIGKTLSQHEVPALYAAYNWFFSGQMESVFLQDANSLIIKPHRLV